MNLEPLINEFTVKWDDVHMKARVILKLQLRNQMWAGLQPIDNQIINMANQISDSIAQ
jgi:hypothetical protein